MALEIFGAPAVDALEMLARDLVVAGPDPDLGRLYMAAIKPFRYLIVYPALTRQWERAWRDRIDLIGTTKDEL